VGITAYGVLSRGLLSGRWSKDAANKGAPDFRAHLPRFTGENLDRNLALVDSLRAIAEKKGVSVAQVVIAWALSRGEDIVPLVGARRRDRLSEALVVDVARALGVSHGSVYRHFPSKAALRDAVAERWLSRISAPLGAVVSEDSPAPERLRRWFDVLMQNKRKLLREDPELFATYHQLTAEAREVVGAHVAALKEHLARIIADGVSRGESSVKDPVTAARAVFHATTRFHNPVHAAEWPDPAIDAYFDEVWPFILAGLGARRSSA
jgi:AcrR family transcriptional regulator